MLVFAPSAFAQSRANYYSTLTTTGTENSAVAFKATTPPTSILQLAAACNYDASNPKIAMVFDATSLPANGNVPIAIVPLAAAGSVLPTCGSFSTPIVFANGIVLACSTTGKTLTVDTTSGGNCYFEASK